MVQDKTTMCNIQAELRSCTGNKSRWAGETPKTAALFIFCSVFEVGKCGHYNLENVEDLICTRPQAAPTLRPASVLDLHQELVGFPEPHDGEQANKPTSP